MCMKKTLVLVGMLPAVVLAYAGVPGAITGRMTDSESARPLVAAHVTVVGTRMGVGTDENGEFSLNGLQPGRYELRFSHVGYTAQNIVVDVMDDATVRLDVVLVQAVIPGLPMTVTATRGRLRETPATFSTLEHQDILERHTTQDIPVLLAELPSTTYYSESGNGLGYTYLNIRGFDARRVAVMINGIPQNDPEDHNVYWLDAPDIAASLEDVQVQRGAGSAFYGSPAIGGSVNLVTSQFGRERAIRLSAVLGAYNTRKYSVSLFSGLVGERYAMHARLSKILSDGYRDRAWVDFSSYFVGVVRYDEKMTTQFNFYGGPVADGLAYYGIPKRDVTDPAHRRDNPILRPEEIENFSQPHYELLHEWRLSPQLTLQNTLFLILGNGFFDYDGSWAPYSYYRLTPQNGFAVEGDPDTLFLPAALIHAEVSNRQWGWLPRLTWKYEHGELLVGGEFRTHRSLHWGRLNWTGKIPIEVPFDYRYYEYRGAKEIVSLYAHTLVDVSPRVKLMADLQYAYNRYRLYDEKYVGTDFAVPYHFLNPRVGVNYNIDEVWNGYLSLAYTSREPRLKNLYDAAEASTPAAWGAVVPQFEVDPSGNPDYARPLVRPEALFDVEVGGGYNTGGARLSANLYWMEFTDEIVKSGQVDRFGQPVTGNAERTRHAGIELSGKADLSTGLECAANATFSRNRFVRHTDYTSGTPLVLDGNPIAGFPDFLANARLTYRHERLILSLAGRYVGKQYTDNFRSEDNTVDQFFVADAWASYTFGQLVGDVTVEAKLQVNNLFDVLYAAYGEGTQFFVGAERNLLFHLTISL
jgi:iron complex outermembrane recepter protein